MSKTAPIRKVQVAIAAVAMVALSVTTVGTALANFEGITFQKDVVSPAAVGSPYQVAYLWQNNTGTHNTLKVTGVTDSIASAGGAVPSGPELGGLSLIFDTAGVTCTGGAGAGTVASPYIGATSCDLAFGAQMHSNFTSFYTITNADFGLPNHQIADTATTTFRSRTS